MQNILDTSHFMNKTAIWRQYSPNQKMLVLNKQCYFVKDKNQNVVFPRSVLQGKEPGGKIKAGEFP